MIKFLKDNIFMICLFIGIFLFSLLFPFSGDDIQWSLISFSLDMFGDFATNTNLNGRYLGNFFVVLMTKNIFIRGLFMAVVLTAIVGILKKEIKVHPIVITFLLLCMPRDIFSQGIVWTSGFTNYVISSLFLLFSLLLLKNNMNNKHKKMPFCNFLVLFLSSLFVENLTIFLVLLTIVMNVIYFLSHKKIDFSNFIAFLGTLVGVLVMFLHPAYHQVLNGRDGYRSLGGSLSEIFDRIFNNLKDVIYRYTLFDNMIVVFLITILLLIYFYRNKSKYNKIMSYIIQIIHYYMIAFTFYTFLSHFAKDWSIFLSYTETFNVILTLVFAILLIVDTILLFNKSMNFVYFLSILLSICGLVAPLLIVWPIGPRNFFMIYMLEVIFILMLIKEINLSFNLYKTFLFIFMSVYVIYYFSIYGYIFLINQRREIYIHEKINEKQVNRLIVPRLPYSDYVWCGDFDNEYLMHLYKIKNGIDSNVIIEFVDYQSWKENKDI